MAYPYNQFGPNPFQCQNNSIPLHMLLEDTNPAGGSECMSDAKPFEPASSTSCMLLPGESDFHWPEDSGGMTITSGSVTLDKDENNLIGISIGGGAPYCPCVYIVQVFDNSPASKDGSLQSGDELVAINGTAVKGKSKVEVARMIQQGEQAVAIKYNKLHADPAQGKNLDLILKKVKHRLVENMSSSTADALGLSRAILCNDVLVKRLEEMKRTEKTYRGLVDYTRRLLRSYYDLCQVYKAFGDVFSTIGVRELQPRASEVFTEFGNIHRQMEATGIKMIRQIKPVLADLGTFLQKAIPDTKLTIRKYADAKFEYLSYCLKVKEMDDEEQTYHGLQEPLYRVETGNYEYRLVLRCRQEARARFAALRSDVQVKLELLDNKHVQDVVQQLQRFLAHLVAFHEECHSLIGGKQFFPIEVDLTRGAFTYQSVDGQLPPYNEDDEPDDVPLAEEAKETDAGEEKLLLLD